MTHRPLWKSLLVISTLSVTSFVALQAADAAPRHLKNLAAFFVGAGTASLLRRRPREHRPVVYADGAREWRDADGLPHRDDGPAIILPKGGRRWYQHGKLHRDDGPAVTDANGSQSWWRDGELHRELGPAVVYADGRQAWYHRGMKFTPDPEMRRSGYKGSSILE